MILTPDIDRSVLISPRASLWLAELEGANSRPHACMFWREVLQRVRLRGGGSGRSDWPGTVFIPSHICGALLRRGVFSMPSGWATHSAAVDACLFSLLATWQVERPVVEFSPLITRVIAESTVNMSLSDYLFANLPWGGFYVDLEAAGVTDVNLPYGFFVGLDQSAKGRLRLLAAIDYGDRLDLVVIPLLGEPAEQVAARLSARPNSGPAGFSGSVPNGIVHLVLSATLMACANQARLEIIDDGVSAFGSRPPWLRWRAGNGIEAAVAEKIDRARVDALGEPVLVSEWREVERSGIAQLHCSAGYGYQPRRAVRF